MSLTYTATGRRATAVDSRGTTTYSYDQRDRLTQQRNPDGQTLAYTYDAHGNRASVATAAGATSYTYDATNRLSTVTDPRGQTTGYQYDAAGNRTRVTLPNGASSFTYNQLNRLTAVEARRVTGEVVVSFAYTLGPTGNRLSVTSQTGRQNSYVYDALQRLTRESISDPIAGSQVVNYGYDAVGNRTTRLDAVSGTTNYGYDANDRLQAEGTRTYSYDANGNTLSRADTSGTTTFGYDFENRLTTAAGPGGALGFGYDADGMRISSTAGGNTSRFVVDANRQLPTVLAELDGTGQVRADYTYGDLSQARGGATSFFLADAQGSTRALLDASGATTDTYNYDAFGNLASSTGATPNDYLFTGQQLDRGLGLYNLRAREYNPSIGRLTTRDTWAGSPMSPLTLNKYGYANADPVNRIDPTGNQGVLEFSIAINLDAILIGMLVLIAALILTSIFISLYQSHLVSTITLPSLGTTLTSTAAGTQAIARARTEARTKVEEAERTNPGCGGNLLYHYTGQAAATSIEAEQNMWLTRQWTDPTSGNVFPRGVYATDIPPWAVMTQAELAKVFYFSARRQSIADLSWVVVICNDVPPPFIPLGAGQWVKADGNVHVIAILPNPMP